MPEATTRVTGLQNGQIQFLLGGGAVPPDQLSVIQKMDNVKVELADSYYNDFLAFNTQHKPFDNVKVRQALNYAIDKKAVWKNAVGEFGLIGRAVPVAPRMWVFAKEKWAAAYEQLPAYDLDLAKAKALFAESGAKPEDLTGKVIVTDEDPVRMSQALALQAAAKELGADMEIKKITNQELNTTAFSAERDYDVLAIPWGSDFPDPAGNLMPVFHSRNVGAGGSNFANYKNEALDKVLDAQQSEPDNTKRADKMIEAEKIIAEETPWIVFGHQKQMLVINNGYEGYLPNPLWYWDPFLKDVKKK